MEITLPKQMYRATIPFQRDYTDQLRAFPVENYPRGVPTRYWDYFEFEIAHCRITAQHENELPRTTTDQTVLTGPLNTQNFSRLQVPLDKSKYYVPYVEYFTYRVPEVIE